MSTGGTAGGQVAREATRRVVLAAAASLPLGATGCSKGIGGAAPPPAPPPPDAPLGGPPPPGDPQHSPARPAHGARAPRRGARGPLPAQHREPLARLRARLIEPHTGGRPEPSPSASASPPGARVPGTPAAARAYLRHAEQAAAQTLLAALTAAPPSLAQLLAS